MQVQLTRWGNSLGMRIPKSLAVQFGLSDGAQVEIGAEDGRLVISFAKPRYELSELLTGIGHDDLKDAFDWGDDLGREAIE